MKKSILARGFIGSVASLLGVCAVGCGADVGPEGAAGDSAEIGSVGQALNGAAPTVLALAANSLPANQDRKLAASCTMIDPVTGTEYYVIAGGIEPGTPSVLSSILASPGGGAWSTLGVSLQSARADLAGIQHPSDPSKCIFAGGESLTNVASSDVDVLSVSNGVFSIATATDMSVARSRFALSHCGTKLVAMGGHNGLAEISSIETSNALIPSAAWTLYNSGANDLNDGRFEFAFAKDPAASRYIVAGGAQAGGAIDSIEVITTSTVNSVTCVPAVTKIAATLSNAVQGNVAFPEGTTGVGTTDFIVTAGADDSGNLPTTVDKLTINWGTPSSSSKSSSGAIVGVYRPALVGPIVDRATPANKDAFMLVGGGLFTGTALPPTQSPDAASDAVQQYQSGFSFDNDTLNNARFGNTAVLLGATALATGTVFSASGQNDFTAPVDGRVDVERITP